MNTASQIWDWLTRRERRALKRGILPGEEYEDALHDAFLYLLDHPHPGREACYLHRWVQFRTRPAKPLLLDARDSWSAEEVFFQKEFMSTLGKVLGTLTPREQFVLKWRFGLWGCVRAHTLEEVGELYARSGLGGGGHTRERIRQIEAKALRRLRHPSRCKLLRDYYEPHRLWALESWLSMREYRWKRAAEEAKREEERKNQWAMVYEERQEQDRRFAELRRAEDLVQKRLAEKHRQYNRSLSSHLDDFLRADWGVEAYSNICCWQGSFLIRTGFNLLKGRYLSFSKFSLKQHCWWLSIPQLIHQACAHPDVREVDLIGIYRMQGLQGEGWAIDECWNVPKAPSGWTMSRDGNCVTYRRT